MVDCHTHVFPAPIRHRLTTSLGREFGRNPSGDGSPEDLLAHLDQAGLARAICFTAALKPDQMVPANSWMLNVRRTYPRLLPLGTVHPGHPAWQSELDRLERNGIRGLKIHPDLTDIALGSPIWKPVWEAVENRFLIMLHMGPIRKGEATLSTPRELAEILDTFRRLRVIAAHLGGLHLWEETLTHLIGRDLYLDTSCCPGVIPPQVLRRLLQCHDPDRILFGSDYPLFAPDQTLAALTRLIDPAVTSIERILMNGTQLAQELETCTPPDVPSSSGR